MSGFTEKSTVQAALLDRLMKPDLGWQYIPASQLTRTPTQVLCEGDLRDALIGLNPVIADQSSRVDEVLPRIRAVLLAVQDDGLMASNRRMMEWLRGLTTYRFVGTDRDVPIRLIDFEHPGENNLVVSDEVVFVGADTRRYDVVLWVNGFPLVVGEAKTATHASVSWLNGAKDIHDCYEERTAAFFVPNVLSFATEGKELRYGAIRQPPEQWLTWSRTTEPITEPSLGQVLKTAALLLRPELILEILNTFSLYSTRAEAEGTVTRKVIPRYPQVEAVEAIVARVRDPRRNQGLIWHHQGSGKTLLMAFAAAKLRREATGLDAPTIVVVLDRLDLFDQLVGEFRSVGIAQFSLADSREDLRRQLARDTRGVIVTTIFRFADAGLLNTRRNIVVLVDEAHRTQEGRLGADMRAALPNANLIGLTGTPVSGEDRNTWAAFGDPGDPDGVLNHYSVERSIADGATLPVHVETRLVDYHINAEALDRAYAELADQEDLTDEEQAVLATKAGTVGALLGTPARVQAVAEDIVAHYRAKLAPLGLKAQVVVYDRALCVAYQDAISTLLTDGEESTVVMTANTGKDGDPDSWRIYDRTRSDEADVVRRFRDVHDPLKLLIVTAKLLTGFDAPIEGVMYLDKPLRAHTLFQAVARTNRRWTNPITGQEKLHGLVVDYVGLGNEIAKALQVGDTGGGRKLPVDVDTLYGELASAIATALGRFDGIDRAETGFATLRAAQDRLDTTEAREAFAREFITAQGLFEFLWPATELRPYEADYRWLAKIYASVQPSDTADTLLWMRLGAKTTELIAAHIGDVTVDRTGLEEVVLDAGTVEAIQQLGFDFPEADERPGPPTAEEVLDSVAARLARKLAGKPHPVYESLARRLDDLRQAKLAEASASVEFLKRLLELAREVVQAERAEAEGQLDEYAESLLPDPNLGALTQIFLEFKPDATPEILERIVSDIDTIVRSVRFSGWQTSQPGDREVRKQLRLILTKYGLPMTGPLFDRAYAYVAQHY